MSKSIEQELHEILEEIAPETHDIHEQAQIVAHASAIYKRAATNSRTAKRNEAKVHESRLMDSLLQAMGCLDDWTGEPNIPSATVDGRGLSADQIIHRASYINNNRYSSKGFGANMDIIGDEDLDAFLYPPKEGHGAEDYNFDDTFDVHDPSIFTPKGYGRHRSDSITR